MVQFVDPPPAATAVSDENSVHPSPSPAEETSHKAVSFNAPKQTAKYAPASGGRNLFTEDDDKALLEYMAQCQSENKPLTGKKIYDDFAQDVRPTCPHLLPYTFANLIQFPNHPAQSWRNRWIRVLKPKIDSGLLKYEGLSANSLRRRRAVSASRNSKGVVSRDAPEEQSLSVEESQEEVRDGSVNDQQQQQKRPTQTNAVKSPMQSPESRQADSPTSRPQTPDQMVENRSENASNMEQEYQRSPLTKEDFMAYYQQFADNSDFQPQWSPTIRGQTFELWRLWNVVEAQEVEPEERDWRQVSEDLGFNCVKHETIPDAIRLYYEQHLWEFENTMAGFENEDETQSNQANANPERSPLPSSPPLPSLKRSYDTALAADHNYPHSLPKRPRLDPRSEVPSTPDGKNGTSHPRRETISGPLPSGIRSPDLGSHNAALPPPAQRRIVEPETQDFCFDPETQAAHLESQESVTPSQQLLLESDARSAAAAATPTPARSRPIRGPFLDDDSDSRDMPNVSSATKPRSHTRTSTEANSAGPSTAKHRTGILPRPFSLSQSAAEKRTVLSPTQQRAPPSTAPPIAQKPAQQQQQPPPRARAKESPEDVIEFYMSLGYEYDDVVQALDATSWVPGLAGQVMEKLKGGETLPSNWRGVWTPKDDEALRAVLATTDDAVAHGVKERRKREKKQAKLENKHTREGIEMRIRFLDKREQ